MIIVEWSIIRVDLLSFEMICLLLQWMDRVLEWLSRSLELTCLIESSRILFVSIKLRKECTECSKLATRGQLVNCASFTCWQVLSISGADGTKCTRRDRFDVFSEETSQKGYDLWVLTTKSIIWRRAFISEVLVFDFTDTNMDFVAGTRSSEMIHRVRWRYDVSWDFVMCTLMTWAVRWWNDSFLDGMMWS